MTSQQRHRRAPGVVCADSSSASRAPGCLSIAGLSPHPAPVTRRIHPIRSTRANNPVVDLEPNVGLTSRSRGVRYRCRRDGEVGSHHEAQSADTESRRRCISDGRSLRRCLSLADGGHAKKLGSCVADCGMFGLFLGRAGWAACVCIDWYPFVDAVKRGVVEEFAGGRIIVRCAADRPWTLGGCAE